MGDDGRPGVIDLDAIKARCEATTPGPWEVNGSPHDRHIATVGRHYITKPDRAGRSAHNDEIAAFIAHARTDVPALAAEVERLRAENEVLRAALLQESTDGWHAGNYRVDL